MLRIIDQRIQYPDILAVLFERTLLGRVDPVMDLDGLGSLYRMAQPFNGLGGTQRQIRKQSDRRLIVVSDISDLVDRDDALRQFLIDIVPGDPFRIHQPVFKDRDEHEKSADREA